MKFRYAILAIIAAVAIVMINGCPKSGGGGGNDARTAQRNGGAIVTPPTPDLLKIAFVPSTEAEKIVEETVEFDKLLSAELGIPVKSVVLPHYVAAVEALGTGDCLVGWIPPLAYVYANERHGARPALIAVRKGQPFYQGQIVVRSDSDILTLDDLRGKRFAFVDPNSTSGNLYPRALLKSAGIDPDSQFKAAIYSGGHDTALIAVLQGSVDACACFVDVRERVKDVYPKVMLETRVLAVTEKIPGDPVVLAGTKYLSDEWAKKITDALLAVMHSEEGKKVIYEIYEIEDLIPASSRDFEVVRKMAEELDMDVAASLK